MTSAPRQRGCRAVRYGPWSVSGSTNATGGPGPAASSACPEPADLRLGILPSRSADARGVCIFCLPRPRTPAMSPVAYVGSCGGTRRGHVTSSLETRDQTITTYISATWGVSPMPGESGAPGAASIAGLIIPLRPAWNLAGRFSPALNARCHVAGEPGLDVFSDSLFPCPAARFDPATTSCAPLRLAGFNDTTVMRSPEGLRLSTLPVGSNRRPVVVDGGCREAPALVTSPAQAVIRQLPHFVLLLLPFSSFAFVVAYWLSSHGFRSRRDF